MTDEEYLKEDDFIENTYDELVDESEDSIFKRDKFLLDMMIHAYEEDERRNTLVDSKNSQMIACIGVMLTIQGSLFTYLLSQFFKINLLSINIILSVLALISLGYYIYSMKIFIDAYIRVRPCFGREYRGIYPGKRGFEKQGGIEKSKADGK